MPACPVGWGVKIWKNPESKRENPEESWLKIKIYLYALLEKVHNRESLGFVTSFWPPAHRACAFPSPYLLDVTFCSSRKYPNFTAASRGWYSWTPCYVAEYTVWMQLAKWAEKRHHYLAWSLEVRPCLSLCFGHRSQTGSPSITSSVVN